MIRANLELIAQMAHSKIDNYVIPGLSSSLIGSPSLEGCVRLFECSRDHQENVTPHSHRFDFQCLVLKGWVNNIIWQKHDAADEFLISSLNYSGKLGEYKKESVERVYFSSKETVFNEGQWYSMKHNEIHSIKFSKGAKVLFFEGPQITNKTHIIEPVVNGNHVPTFKVEDWMFSKGKKDA